MKYKIIIDCFASGGGIINCGYRNGIRLAGRYSGKSRSQRHPDEQDKLSGYLHLTEDIFEVDLQKYVKGRKNYVQNT